jgi:hypothetical protein
MISKWFDLSLRGIHYQSRFSYALLDFLKSPIHGNLRFNIIKNIGGNAKSCLDVAGGPGDLANFLPKQCQYTCIDASTGFLSNFSEDGLTAPIKFDLHEGLPNLSKEYDLVTMVISLYQFRSTSASLLLDQFKTVGKKVIIIEEVRELKAQGFSLREKVMNYLCASDFYKYTSLFSYQSFKALAEQHGYFVYAKNKHLSIALYGFEDVKEPLSLEQL